MGQPITFWDLLASLLLIIGDFLIGFALLAAIFYFFVKIILRKKIASIANLLAGGLLGLTVSILGLLGKFLTGEWNSVDNGIFFPVSDTLILFLVIIVLILYLGSFLLSKIEPD